MLKYLIEMLHTRFNCFDLSYNSGVFYYTTLVSFPTPCLRFLMHGYAPLILMYNGVGSLLYRLCYHNVGVRARGRPPKLHGGGDDDVVATWSLNTRNFPMVIYEYVGELAVFDLGDLDSDGVVISEQISVRIVGLRLGGNPGPHQISVY
jgi:hypothetical protein